MNLNEFDDLLGWPQKSPEDKNPKLNGNKIIWHSKLQNLMAANIYGFTALFDDVTPS